MLGRDIKWLIVLTVALVWVALLIYASPSTEDKEAPIQVQIHEHVHLHEHMHLHMSSEEVERQIKMLMYDNLKQYIETQQTPVNEMVYKDRAISISNEDFKCLAKNIFYEAGIEPFEGKLAVAQVTYNRTKVGRGGTTICDVVYAPYQFSWTIPKKRRAPSGPLWEESKKAAKKFVEGKRVVGLEKSIYYHADYVSPRWADETQKVAVIGRHIFYNGSKRS